MEELLQHYQHFNARRVKDAVEAWKAFHKAGGRMFVSIGGAMSTAGIGKSLAPLIEKGYVVGISTTGANLEEDYFRGIGYRRYGHVESVDELTEKDDKKIEDEEYSRVHDVTIPNEVMLKTEKDLKPYMQKAIERNEKLAPHELFYKALKDREEPLKDSWLQAAADKNLHIITPGWEDSSLANGIVGMRRINEIKHFNFVKSGLEQMDDLITWYQKTTEKHPLGFFQIGGGISGDAPICVVPLIQYDMHQKPKRWKYFCQITDSTSSYGSYSGALPQEKISWSKLDVGDPMFSIQSDATIVAPIIFNAMLN